MSEARANCWRRCLIVTFCALLGACASRYEAPIEEEPIDANPPPRARVERDVSESTGNTYLIRSGDTLYSIAWRNSLDFKDIARWNGIKPPYRIFVGQRLRLSPPESLGTVDSKRKTITKRESSPPAPLDGSRPQTESRQPTNAATPAVTPRDEKSRSAVKTADNVHWQWPARGKFEAADSVRGERGINIFGTKGSAVLAAAAGRVVYSGSGLVGYGKLIIIEHNDTFLSAYAHNDKLLVAEGARVVGGQQIAEMGSTGTRQVMLHFEIRRNGQPVPPLQFLP